MENNASEIVNELLKINHYRHIGDYIKSIYLAEKLFEEHEYSYEICSLISDLYFGLASYSTKETGVNYQKAIFWMREAIKKDETNSLLHSKLGTIYWLGILDYLSAEEEFHQAINLDPGNISGHLGLAALYGSPDSNITLDEAMNSLAKAANINPDDPNIHARLGELLFESGKVNEAVDAWSKSLMCSKPLEEGCINSIRTHI